MTGERTDAEIMDMLIAHAKARYDGHLTVMRFTTNWRVMFGTPANRQDIAQMASGDDFADAAWAALAQDGAIP